MILQPLHQRQIIGQAPEQVHRGVGVGVHEARDQGMVFQVLVLRGLVFLFCLGRRQHVDNDTLIDDHAVMIEV